MRQQKKKKKKVKGTYRANRNSKRIEIQSFMARGCLQIFFLDRAQAKDQNPSWRKNMILISVQREVKEPRCKLQLMRSILKVKFKHKKTVL
jgi:hypothetical protein